MCFHEDNQVALLWPSCDLIASFWYAFSLSYKAYQIRIHGKLVKDNSLLHGLIHAHESNAKLVARMNIQAQPLWSPISLKRAIFVVARFAEINLVLVVDEPANPYFLSAFGDFVMWSVGTDQRLVFPCASFAKEALLKRKSFFTIHHSKT